MCISSISAICSWICCTDIPDEPTDPADHFNSKTKFSKSTLVSIEEEGAIREKLSLDISDTLNCLIEWEQDNEARHQHNSTPEL